MYRISLIYVSCEPATGPATGPLGPKEEASKEDGSILRPGDNAVITLGRGHILRHALPRNFRDAKGMPLAAVQKILPSEKQRGAARSGEGGMINF